MYSDTFQHTSTHTYKEKKKKENEKGLGLGFPVQNLGGKIPRVGSPDMLLVALSLLNTARLFGNLAFGNEFLPASPVFLGFTTPENLASESSIHTSYNPTDAIANMANEIHGLESHDNHLVDMFCVEFLDLVKILWGGGKLAVFPDLVAVFPNIVVDDLPDRIDVIHLGMCQRGGGCTFGFPDTIIIALLGFVLEKGFSELGGLGLLDQTRYGWGEIADVFQGDLLRLNLLLGNNWNHDIQELKFILNTNLGTRLLLSVLERDQSLFVLLLFFLLLFLEFCLLLLVLLSLFIARSLDFILRFL